LFTAKRTKQPAKRPALDDADKGFRILGDVVPDGVQVFGQRHVKATANEQFRGGEVKVIARAFVFSESRTGEYGGNMGLVWRFVL